VTTKPRRLELDGNLLAISAATWQWLNATARITIAAQPKAWDVLISSFFMDGAVAAETCKSQADAKKLACAALTSFMKKCESDA
jgi:hypothetical protein